VTQELRIFLLQPPQKNNSNNMLQNDNDENNTSLKETEEANVAAMLGHFHRKPGAVHESQTASRFWLFVAFSYHGHACQGVQLPAQGYMWLTHEDNGRYTQTHLLQWYALAPFYYSTYNVGHEYSKKPSPWINVTNWLMANAECVVHVGWN
jgi:hypothetical protein